MRMTLTLLAALAAAAPAPAAESATEALRARDAEIRAALPPPGGEVTPATRRKVEEIVTRAVDARGMVEASMGKNWAEASEAQRKRLVTAFENRFRQTSGDEFDTYRSTQIEYKPEVAAEDGTVQVPTRVVVKGEPTEITYAMRRERAGAWRICDIVVDGVSTVANYRASFSRIIAKEGIEGLIKRLERAAGSGSK